MIPTRTIFSTGIRDSAAIIEALRQAYEHGAIGEVAIGHLADFVAFTTSLGRLDGRGLVEDPSGGRPSSPTTRSSSVRTTTSRRFMASASAWRRASTPTERSTFPAGRARRTTARPPSRDADALARLWRFDLGQDLRRDIGWLIRAELAFTLRHSRETCFDIWEEEDAHHYYTLRIAGGSLGGRRGLARRRRRGIELPHRRGRDHQAARWVPDTTGRLLPLADLPNRGALHARPRHRRHPRDNHAEGTGTRHLATRSRACRRHWPGSARSSPRTIRSTGTPGRGARRSGAIGGDAYFGGNPWYVATLAAAEFEYRLRR